MTVARITASTSRQLSRSQSKIHAAYYSCSCRHSHTTTWTSQLSLIERALPSYMFLYMFVSSASLTLKSTFARIHAKSCWNTHGAMGLRGFFNSVRKKDGGQNKPNTGNAAPTTTSSTTTTGNTQPSVSQPTTQTTSNTAISVTPPYVKRDLWDEAYEVLRAENEDLIQKYEEIIVEYDKQNAGSTVQQLG